MKITSHIHSIDSLEIPIDIGLVPYVVEEGSHDLTLVDTCLIGQIGVLQAGLTNEGYDIKDVKRLVLTHSHVDHSQAASEVKKLSGARVYAHWIEAAFLRNEPHYHGPPPLETVKMFFSQYRGSQEEALQKFGAPGKIPVTVDQELSEGDVVGRRLKVIYTPGHTPGHISLFSEEDRAIIGGDFLFNLRTGLSLPPESIDPVIAGLSARRVSKLRFEKLLLTHQHSPILEGGAKAIEQMLTSVQTGH